MLSPEQALAHRQGVLAARMLARREGAPSDGFGLGRRGVPVRERTMAYCRRYFEAVWHEPFRPFLPRSPRMTDADWSALAWFDLNESQWAAMRAAEQKASKLASKVRKLARDLEAFAAAHPEETGGTIADGVRLASAAMPSVVNALDNGGVINAPSVRPSYQFWLNERRNWLEWHGVIFDLCDWRDIAVLSIVAGDFPSSVKPHESTAVALRAQMKRVKRSLENNPIVAWLACAGPGPKG